MKQAKLAVFICRGQLVTNSHIEIINRAREAADHVIVLVGSINRSRSTRTPFSYDNVESMIRRSLVAEYGTTYITGINDYPFVQYAWESEVQNVVHTHAKKLGITRPHDIALIGHKKDATSFYLDKFPEWGFIGVESLNDGESATTLRDVLFTTGNLDGYDIPSGTQYFLEDYIGSDEHSWMMNHYAGIAEFRKENGYDTAKYTPTHETGDALFINRGKILLVQRGGKVGYEQWALPGGFRHAGEWPNDAIWREAREETDIAIPDKVLIGAYKGWTHFPGVGRDDRGDISTYVGKFILNENKDPRVRGLDDAKDAKWIPFAQFRKMSKVMFADHYFVIEKMLHEGYGTGFTNLGGTGSGIAHNLEIGKK